jgi:hypothetical protein
LWGGLRGLRDNGTKLNRVEDAVRVHPEWVLCGVVAMYKRR